VLAWLGRYLRNPKAKTGPEFEWLDPRGRSYAARRYRPLLPEDRHLPA